jgi:hypothetical protein
VGVAVAFPEETEAQPAAKRAATSTTMYMPGMRNCFFMEDHVSCDIRRVLYLWVYFTSREVTRPRGGEGRPSRPSIAENPEVTGEYKDFLSSRVAGRVSRRHELFFTREI